MIKAKELRIGNYINDMFGGQCECRGYSIKGIYIRDKSGPAPEDAFSGIPLTEEWLLRFRFERREEVCGNGIGDLMVSYESDGYRFMQDNLGSWFLCGYSWNTEHFNYVHQLQNLYYSLVGEELILKENI